MTMSVSSPVTGLAQTGLTSPTYTLTVDTPPSNGNVVKQWAVTTLGGTQTNVLTHSGACPFTISAIRPATYRGLAPVGSNGLLRAVPRNTMKLVVRKGVTPLAGQSPAILTASLVIDVPAGSPDADANSVAAAISLLGGAISQLAAGIGDTAKTNIF